MNEIEPNQHPSWIPRPLPSNREAYEAFAVGLVTRVRNVMTGQKLGFDWPALAVRLEVRGFWTREIEEKLTIMEAEMLNVVASTAEVASDGA